MRGSALTFHGDRSDLESLFTEWFGGGDLFLAEVLSELNKDIAMACSPDFAMSRLVTSGSMSCLPMVIGPSDQPLNLRKRTMNDGSGTKQEVDLTNRFVVGILIGGETGVDQLQPTVLTTSGDDEEAALLYKRLKRTVTKSGRKIRHCWVLPGAYGKLLQGWRLPGGQFQAQCTDLPVENA